MYDYGLVAFLSMVGVLLAFRTHACVRMGAKGHLTTRLCDWSAAELDLWRVVIHSQKAATKKQIRMNNYFYANFMD